MFRFDVKIKARAKKFPLSTSETQQMRNFLNLKLDRFGDTEEGGRITLDSE